MTDEKVYSGVREDRVVTYTRAAGELVPTYQHQQFKVTVNGKPLDPHYEVIGYTAGLSETFEWGTDGGRGEYQLAVAILTDAYGAEIAKRCVTQFAREVIRKFRDNWSLTEAEVFAAVLSIEMETRDAPVYVEPPASTLPFLPSSAVLAGCGLPPAVGLPPRKRRTRKKRIVKKKNPPAQPPPIPLAIAV